MKSNLKQHAFRPAAVIKVSGEDAFSFLQGQFTNELRPETGSASYGLWLNQKGKVLADSFVLNDGPGNFLVISLTSPSAIVCKRLESYVVADDVVLSDETEQFAGLAIWGDGCDGRIAALLGTTPESKKFAAKTGAFGFRGRRTTEENYEIVGPLVFVEECERRLAAEGGEKLSADAVEQVRITAGVPAVPADIGATDLPNEGSLEAVAISYTKGCYLGQEVMARLKNLGQVRRSLRTVQGTGALPKSGTALFQGPKKAGELRSVVATPDGFIGFAMLTLLGMDPSLGFGFEPTVVAGEGASVWMNSPS